MSYNRRSDHTNFDLNVFNSLCQSLYQAILGLKIGTSSIFLIGILVMCWWAAKTEYMKYKDPKQLINVRVKDLLSRMTLEEKIGQMSQIDRTVASAEVMKKYFLGSILSGGGSVPAKRASVETWVNMVNDFQEGSLATRLGIPMIYGIDAVHGHNYLPLFIIWGYISLDLFGIVSLFFIKS